MINKIKRVFVLSIFALVVVGCNKSAQETDNLDELSEAVEIEAAEQKLDEKTEVLKEETQNLEEEVDALLEGI